MSDVWPSAPIVVPDKAKELITRFFDISDSIDPTSGKLFAEELFVEDGYFKTHKTCVFNGHDEIASSRKGMSPVVAYRKHYFTQIYAANSPASDIAVLGKFELGFKDGSSFDLEFTARFVVAEEGRLRSVEVFTDGGATKAAYEKATKALVSKE